MASGAGRLGGGLATLLAATALVLRRWRPRIAGMRRRVALAGLLLIGTGPTACGGLTSNEATPSVDAASPPSVIPPDACTDELGARVIEHACRHGQFGPFDDAVALASPTGALPQVSRVHYAYRVVPEEGAAGHVLLVPRREGEHVLFTSQGEPAVLTSDGQPVPPLHVQDVDGCEVFRRAAVFSFRSGEGRVLRVGGSAGETTLLFVEHMGTFGEGAWLRCEE
jgi:hypothetical protein